MKKVLVTSTDSMMKQFLEPHVLNLIEQGCEVDIACSEVSDRMTEIRNNLEGKVQNIYHLSLKRSPISSDNVRGYRELKKIISDKRYDLIWTNEPVMGVATRLAAGKTRKSGTTVMYMAHGFHFYKGAPLLNWLVFYPVEKLFAHMTDKLFTINYEDYERAKRKFQTKVYHIHGIGVDGQRYCPADEDEKKTLREELGFNEKQKILLCIGELLPNKNQTMAIRMMKNIVKKYSDSVLVIAGKGSEKENLEREISDCGLENNVRMTGYCTCLEKYQKTADVLVSCSKREGLPLNLVEAMLSGNPVVATKNRGHCELVQNGETGFLVDVGDEKGMSECVLKILGDEKLKREMGKRAHEFAMAYEIANVSEELKKAYML